MRPLPHDCGASANNSMLAVPSAAIWSANAHEKPSIRRRPGSRYRGFGAVDAKHRLGRSTRPRALFACTTTILPDVCQYLYNSTRLHSDVVSVNAAASPHAGSCDKQRIPPCLARKRGLRLSQSSLVGLLEIPLVLIF
jgi:hypothetical protein